MTTATLSCSRVQADDEAALRSWYDLRRLVEEHDLPGDPEMGWSRHVGQLRHPWPGTEVQAFLAHQDGELVGWFGFSLPLTENRDAAYMELQVHPAHRRRGVGRALLAEVRARVLDLGRRRVIAGVTGPVGEAFAAGSGARAVLADTQRRLDLTTLDTERLEVLWAEATSHSSGYSLLQWVGVTPEEYLEAVAALESRMTTDAPMDDLQWEQVVFDADRYRGHDAVMVARRNRAYTSAARHDGTGVVVGTTTLVVVDGVDDSAGQFQTIVDPAHRGYRLGLLLKVANLRYLQLLEPAVTRVDTWNADSNAPMLKVNVDMGFQPVRQWAEWELVL